MPKSATQTATRPTSDAGASDAAPVASLPFQVASRQMTRFSFTAGTVAMQAAASTPISVIQIPAVGYLSAINLEVTVSTTSTGLTFNADAPFNVLQAIEFKTAAGNDIIVPLTGYQMYLANKYGTQFSGAPWSDAKLSRQYSAITGTNGSAHFFLPVPLEIDAGNGMGSIPALASNRSYQLQLTLAAISTVFGGTVTAASVTITGTAYYWSEPPAVTQNGVSQTTAPRGLGTLSQWQVEQPPITPGDKYMKSNNVGNVIRCLIFTLRNSSGARIDTNGWPGVSELYLDNEPMFYFTQNEWEDNMVKWYGLSAATKDVAQGLDTGVYVIPFHLLTANAVGDAMSRAQYLATIDASQLQLRGTSWGSAVSTLEILTNSVIPSSASDLFSQPGA
jgi:hypothetical protein